VKRYEKVQIPVWSKKTVKLIRKSCRENLSA
jgi:hypothetical protein